MKRTHFRIEFTGEDRLEVTFETERGRVASFVVNYVARIEGKDYSVVRYDTAHGFPHKDICRPDGSLERKERMPHLELDALVEAAIGDLKQNWEPYRRRFEGWLK